MKFEDDDLQEIPGEIAELPSYIRDMGCLVRSEPIARDDVGDRCFSLLGGRVIFGLLLGEFHDSFLVALASSLVSDGRDIEGKLMTASPVIRLFKNGVAFMSVPEPEHRYYYYRHISRLTGMMPGFFNAERTAKIEKTISDWNERMKLNRFNSPSDSAQEEEGSPVLFAPYDSTTRH